MGPDGFRTYTNLQDYIEEYTFNGPISFNKLDYLFRIYFILLILIFCSNLIHLLIKYFKNLKIKIRLINIF